MAQVPRANTSNRAMEVVREFRKLNPPMFDGVSSDPLVADHWLSEIRKLFDVLDVTEDAVRVKLVACQLSGRANEWWKSVLATRKASRGLARTEENVNEPDVENMTWAEFEAIFEDQCFPESFKKLVQPPITCHQCGQPGHIRTHCPNPKTLPPPPSRVQGTPGACFGCGRLAILLGFVHSGEVLVVSPVRFSSRGQVLGLVDHHRGVHTRNHIIARLLRVRAHKLIEGLVLPRRFRLHRGWVFAVTAATPPPPPTSQTPESSIVQDRRFEFDFIMLSMSGFDLILGMDWLLTYQATIDCFRCRVRICTSEGGYFEFFGE
ncbi:hypothetical protein Acr_24g0008920 [Actinidia rufa]|uniref:CCHC-type domain-containing protein n=1 Tax=Actinidia rufa TaxID=165716 RepID=A0A7J0GV95_9ERIC|nr:hypothetical protein Acr_24g0008920 [Actinidia rufa]